MTLKNDGLLTLAIGASRKEISWKNTEMSWSSLVERVSVTHRTAETQNAYFTAKKDRQDEIKDIGGFVGGVVSGGRRLAKSISCRQLITLDADNGAPGMWDDFTLIYGCAACMYSTHKHTPEQPRLRLLIPLDREVLADEYEAIARAVAGMIGIDQFDTTTFQPHRLMYWPSTSIDAEYAFEVQDGSWLNADKILAGYRDWKDVSQWPVAARVQKSVVAGIGKQEDPTLKGGIIGAFCRMYSISDAIEKFLPKEYAPAGEGRYSFTGGSTSGGVVTYDDKFSFSHHGTDPTSGVLCNAFDLVRLHKFGDRDKDVSPTTANSKRPSYLAMIDFAFEDDLVKKEIAHAKAKEISEDFRVMATGEIVSGTEFDTDWLADLDMDMDKKCNYLSTLHNIYLILKHSPHFKDLLARDTLEQRERVLGPMPWTQSQSNTGYFTDSDVAFLQHYLEHNFGITGNSKIEAALNMIFTENAVHPVREYLDSLRWDGKKRIETLLIDYFGAKDNIFTRQIIRKVLVAAVARIMDPGCKFDYMLVIVGPQGIAKSTFIQKMAVKQGWYSESFADIRGKQGQEAVQGVWLAEFGEIAGFKKQDVDFIKQYVTARTDRFRVAFGKRVEMFPRQCIFIGTTNNRQFLKDQTGNRRFPIVDLYGANKERKIKNVFKDLDKEVGQIWAEAVTYYNEGEELILTPDVEAMAANIQANFTETDERAGIIGEYLNRLLPEDWYKRSLIDRARFMAQNPEDLGVEKGTMLRDKICVAEIWCELFGRAQGDMTTTNTKEIHKIMSFDIPGWEKVMSVGRFGEYGIQRWYKRIEDEL